MAQKIVVETKEWKTEGNRFKYARELERGNILYFEKPPFLFPQEEIDFLLKQKQSSSKGRKNIAYKPGVDQITNHDASDPLAAKHLHEILRNYSKRVTDFLKELLPSYQKGWKHDYASFRPFEEKGRPLRTRARNDLLHIDAFPTRPVHGARILRFFTNINPTQPREWITSSPFGELLRRYGGTKGLPFPASMRYRFTDRFKRKAFSLLRQVGLKIPERSPYDQFMLRMHHFLKENHSFQKECVKDHWLFPPGSCWIVFTDMVSHAALSGQYALEQTFLISEDALLYPELSPVSLLERMTGKNFVDPEQLVRYTQIT